MANRILLLLILVAMMVLVQSAQGQVISAPIPIGMGFSQGTVAPVDAGIPVYTVGDQLWFESYTSLPIDVIVTPPEAAGSGAVLSLVGVLGNTTLPILTFSSQDPSGLWSLTVSNSTGAQTVVRFFFLGGYSPLQLTGYGVGSDGLMSLNYTLSDPSAYGLSTCIAGNASLATVSVPIPTTAGGGNLLLTLNGSSVSVFPEGNKAPFQYWLGLKQNYALEAANQTFLTRSETVAQTQPALVNPGSAGAYTTALQEALPLATGEFTLVSNFELSSGASIHDTDVLVTGTGSWVWLQDCLGTSNPVSTSFTVNAPLQGSASQWPRTLYVLYTAMGVSLFSVSPVDVQPSRIELIASPWNETLTYSRVQVTGATQYSVGDGAVYLVGEQYPMQVRVAVLTVRGTLSQSVNIDQPYSSVVAYVPANQVVVHISPSASAPSGVLVTLNDSSGTVATQDTASGEAVFYVPAGNFTVSAVYNGQTQTAQVVSDGAFSSPAQRQDVTISFGVGSGTGVETYALVASLILGIGVSGVVWALAYRRRNP